MPTYVVTGGNGFIGRALVQKLRACGNNVIVATREKPHYDQTLDWIEYDLRDPKSAISITDLGADGIFHLAWSTTPAAAEQSPVADIITNLAGTIRLLDQMAKKGEGRVVLVSSGGAIYGEAGDRPISELQQANPIGIYGTTKLAMERYASSCKLFENLDVRIARISNPFGPGQSLTNMQGAATAFARKIIKREPIEIWGDGHVVRDYVDVVDVASGLMSIMNIDTMRCAGAPIYNVGSGEGISLVQLIKKLEDASGLRPEVLFKAPRNFDVPVNILDVSKLRDHSQWMPGDVTTQLRAFMLDLCREIEEQVGLA